MFSSMKCYWLLLLKSLEQTLTQSRRAVLLLLWLKKRQKLFSLEVTFCDFHASKSEVEGFFFPLPSSDIIHLVGWCISTHRIRWLMFWTNGCKRVEPWARWGWRLAHTDVETDEMPPPRFHVTEAVQLFFFFLFCLHWCSSFHFWVLAPVIVMWILVRLFIDLLFCGFSIIYMENYCYWQAKKKNTLHRLIKHTEFVHSWDLFFFSPRYCWSILKSSNLYFYFFPSMMWPIRILWGERRGSYSHWTLV